ncbi:hypothetical protein ACRAWD_26610 [Caulobacter segnis]
MKRSSCWKAPRTSRSSSEACGQLRQWDREIEGDLDAEGFLADASGRDLLVSRRPDRGRSQIWEKATSTRCGSHVLYPT